MIVCKGGIKYSDDTLTASQLKALKKKDIVLWKAITKIKSK